MKVFISHITEEKSLALTLKDWVESSFAGQCEVFVSSDINDIPAGSRWLQQIENAAHESAGYLVLCSPTSVWRPWINFETGCAWIRQIPIIPICHSGQKKSQLPTPLSTFQALEIDSDDFVSDLLTSLAQYLEVTKVPRIDQSAMRHELESALRQLSTESASQPPAMQMHPAEGDLEDAAINILKTIADLGDKGYSVEELASRFSMSHPKMQYYLDILREQGLVDYRGAMIGVPARYTLSKMGRKCLVERNML